MRQQNISRAHLVKVRPLVKHMHIHVPRLLGHKWGDDASMGVVSNGEDG